MASDELHQSVESELREEKAAALGRVTRRLEAALAALAAADQAVAAIAPDDPARPELAAARQHARREAARWLWYVRVQRECIGLVDHDQLMELYRVPREVRGLY